MGGLCQRPLVSLEYKGCEDSTRGLAKDPTQLQAEQNFASERRDLVLTLKKLSQGKHDNGTPDQIAFDLSGMVNLILFWQVLENDTTGSCFAHPCQIISDALGEVSDRLVHVQQLRSDDREMLDMLAMQIGRLTLHGYTDEDDLAVGMARLTEQQEHEWKTSETEETPMDESERRHLRFFWARVHFKMDGCGCRQCLGMYSLAPSICSSPSPQPPTSSSSSDAPTAESSMS